MTAIALIHIQMPLLNAPFVETVGKPITVNGARSYQITLRAVGGGATKVAVEESNDGQNFFHVEDSPFTLSVTASSSPGERNTASAMLPDSGSPRNYMRATVMELSGTSADVLVMAAVI